MVGAAAVLLLLLLPVLAAAALPKRLGVGPEDDGALVAAGLLAPKEKAGFGAAGESGKRRGHVKVALRRIILLLHVSAFQCVHFAKCCLYNKCAINKV